MALERKNKALDALHHVWCSGGCKVGMHRYDTPPITEEILLEAEREVKRMRQWWENNKQKQVNDTNRLDS